jgi:hypothetical protein
MPIYETGHARNVQHFQEMISFIDSWGAAYAPTNTAISLEGKTSARGKPVPGLRYCGLPFCGFAVLFTEKLCFFD